MFWKSQIWNHNHSNVVGAAIPTNSFLHFGIAGALFIIVIWWFIILLSSGSRNIFRLFLTFYFIRPDKKETVLFSSRIHRHSKLCRLTCFRDSPTSQTGNNTWLCLLIKTAGLLPLETMYPIQYRVLLFFWQPDFFLLSFLYK